MGETKQDYPKQIRVSINEYNEAIKSRFLQPISEVDYGIISILKGMLQAKGVNLKSVFSKYKVYSDKEVFESLLLELDKVRSNASRAVSTKEEEQVKAWFEFNNDKKERMLLSQIVRQSVGHDAKGFYILVNETNQDVTNKPLYSDTKVYYDEEEERNEDFEKLKFT